MTHSTSGSLTRPGKRLRIAIASVDIAGPYHCGGVGAAYHGLASLLAREGHEVTVVYLHPKFHKGSKDEWIQYFRDRNVDFVHIPEQPDSPIWYANRKEASHRCYQWLSRQAPFDVIHFHEWLGLPYYSLVAKHQKLAFENTLLCVGTHGPMRWSRIGDETLPVRAEDLVVDFLERKSVELADAVVSPSQYLFDWMREDGWSLPGNSVVINNVLDSAGSLASGEPVAGRVNEIVFFGRLDRRKGLPVFCDAIDRLYAEYPDLPARITFLGGNVSIDGKTSVAYLERRAASWPATPTILTDLDRNAALQYLATEGRLAVIPSMIDNSPCTVQECLQEGIPFLASDCGGVPELIDPRDRERVTFRLDAASISKRLRTAVEEGMTPGRLSEKVSSAGETWLQWHSEQTAVVRARAAAPAAATPLVSVCIAHYERPDLLEQMIESLRTQTYSNLEVVLVDDGSRSSEAQDYLQKLEQEFGQRGWQLRRQQNAGPGAARDLAARSAKGEYLLFADDDDALFPNAVETFVGVARRTGADACSGILMEFEGPDVPERLEQAVRPLIPLGAALAPGLIAPEFGGTAYMVTRQCYFDVGGFPAHRDCDEDWEFLLKVVARGYRLEAIPEPLVWYRIQPESRSRADNRFLRNRSRIAVYEKLLPLELRDLAALAFSRLSGGSDAASQRRLERVIQSLEKVRRERKGRD